MDSGSSPVFIWHKQVSCANGCRMCQRLPAIHICIAAFMLIFGQACTLKQESEAAIQSAPTGQTGYRIAPGYPVK